MELPVWSFSSMKMFQTCPKQYYHLRVAKDYVAEPTAATQYGGEFHKACEDYMRDGTPLDWRFIHVKPVLDALRSIRGDHLCEYHMAVDRRLAPCGFDAAECFVRGIGDLVIVQRDRGVAYYVDYKTGKSSRFADTGQLELMALLIFAHMPEIRTVRGRLLFVVANEEVRGEYRRADSKALWVQWLRKYQQLLAAHDGGVWNAKPSGLCRRHCPVTECPHHG